MIVLHITPHDLLKHEEKSPKISLMSKILQNHYLILTNFQSSMCHGHLHYNFVIFYIDFHTNLYHIILKFFDFFEAFNRLSGINY